MTDTSVSDVTYMSLCRFLTSCILVYAIPIKSETHLHRQSPKTYKIIGLQAVGYDTIQYKFAFGN